ncbi:hypothetical protein MMC12_006257 [Toensbergia leucococca]|nr:hypothetical protein [Toensbergia leucococca]
MAFFLRTPQQTPTTPSLLPILNLLSATSPHHPALRTCRSPQPQKIFTPKFDVLEHQTYYELQGDLPGLSQENISIEFTDAQTLVIKGHLEREPKKPGAEPKDVKTEPEKEAQAEDKSAQRSRQPSNASESLSSYEEVTSYQKASVEDEAPASTTSTATVTAAPTPAAEAPEQTPTKPSNEAPKPKYWVQERASGDFRRVFNFADRVDQEGVKAKLREGVLSVVVPKAAIPAVRKIEVL